MRSRARKVVAAFALSMAVSGCVTTTQLASLADQIIEATRRTCQFAPTVTSVLALLSVPGAPQANALVVAICKEVDKKPRSERVRLGQPISVEVMGVQVNGVSSR
jgi:hypothetical protein